MLKPDYKWELLLYPDAENYNCDEVIESAKSFFDEWAYILHDQDFLPTGELKKSHIHFLGRFLGNEKQTPNFVIYELKLPENSIGQVHSWKKALRYLCHLDNPEKASYPIDNVQSNFDILTPLRQLADDVQARMILEYIVNCRGSPSVTKVCSWALQNNCYASFRRGFAVFSKIINEKSVIRSK